MTSRTSWRRVTRAHPCRICGRPDWCLFAGPEDDPTAAICARIESPKRCGEGGWLHRLKERPDGHQHRPILMVRVAPSEASRADLARLAAQWRREIDPGRLNQLAVSLGLSLESLSRLGIGWSAEHRAWTFPMSDAIGNVVGIRLRRPNSFKFSVTGGKEGLFIPSTVETESAPLVICEGPTDTAALLDMGFRNVVGRPSCTGGIKLLVEWMRRRLPDEVVIVSDGDEPGRLGASNLASVLVLYAPAVRIIVPSEGIKDAREWLRAGGTRRDVEQVIEAAVVRRLAIRARPQAEQGGK